MKLDLNEKIIAATVLLSNKYEDNKEVKLKIYVQLTKLYLNH